MNRKSLKIKDIAKSLSLFTARPNSVQRASLLSYHLQNNIFYTVKNIATFPISKTDDEWFFSGDDFDNLALKQAEEFFEPGFISEYKKRTKEYLKSWLHVCKNVKESVLKNNPSNKEIADSLNLFFKYPALKETYFYFTMVVWSFDQRVVPEYMRKLESYYGDKFNRIRNIITSQTKLSEEQEMRLELAKIKEEKGEKIEDKYLSEIQKKYRYLGIYSPEEYGTDLDSFKNIYKEIDTEKVFNIKEEIKENREKFLDIKSKLKDQEIKEAIEQINFNVYFRTIRSERLSYGFSLVTPAYQYLSKKLNFSLSEVGNLTNEEIIDYLNNGNVPQKRKERPAVLFQKGKALILTEKESDQIKEMMSSSENSDSVKGTTAYKGVVKGEAKIITSVNNINKVKKGDVLISQFTRPEYLPAMKRAVAFVTNDGGITSHAAIMARELKKPCIIGTGNATKIIKNGDKVEVNADEGIVKIINRKN